MESSPSRDINGERRAVDDEIADTPIPEAVRLRRNRKQRDPMLVLQIIGIGNSGGSDIARFKDVYLAEVADRQRS